MTEYHAQFDGLGREALERIAIAAMRMADQRERDVKQLTEQITIVQTRCASWRAASCCPDGGARADASTVPRRSGCRGAARVMQQDLSEGDGDDEGQAWIRFDGRGEAEGDRQ
jgi:hypothetical protein